MDWICKIPLIATLKSYQKGNFKFDLIAGLTVAIVALPQSMAYALIAGVAPVYGFIHRDHRGDYRVNIWQLRPLVSQYDHRVFSMFPVFRLVHPVGH
jgi:hypothetical protein